MASSYNSRSLATLNGGNALDGNNANGTNGFVGQWEDVKEYTSVVTTIIGDAFPFKEDPIRWTGRLRLQWSVGSAGTGAEATLAVNPPLSTNPSIIATDTITVNTITTAFTRQVDTRARWFRLVFDVADANGASAPAATTANVRISTIFKKNSTEIKVVDDAGTIVNVNPGTNNAMYTALTDSTGSILGTTQSGDGSALYTSLTDSNGSYMATTTRTNITRISTLNNSLTNGTFQSTGLQTWGTLVQLVDTFGQNDTTINVEENTFSVPINRVTFRDGDIVNFFVYRPTTSANLALPGDGVIAVTVGSGTDNVGGHAMGNGAIRAQARVRVIRIDITHVIFQLLVNTNTSAWFDTTGITLNTAVTSEYASQVGAGTTYRLLVSTAAGVRATIDNYYTIIANGQFNGSTSVQLTPGRFPLDLRLYNGSRGSVVGDQAGQGADVANIRTAAFQFVSGTNNEALMVGLRDANGNNITSTSGQVDNYTFIADRFTKLKMHIMIDGRHVPSPGQPSAFFNGTTNNFPTVRNAYLGTGATSFLNRVQTISNNTSLSSTVPTSNYYVKASMMVDNNANGTALSGITLVKTGGNFENPTVTDAPDTDFNLSLWTALSENISITAPANTATIRDGVDTLIFILGNLEAIQINDEVSKNIFIDRYSLVAPLNIIFIVPKTSAMSNQTASAAWKVILEIAGSEDNIIQYDNYATLISDTFRSTLAQRVTSVRHRANNALAVHPSNRNGTSQASTASVGAASFSGVAMHYALADHAGNQVDTTKTKTNVTTSLNAMYVSLAVPNRDATGANNGYTQVSNSNPLYVSMSAGQSFVNPFDVIVGSSSITTPVVILASPPTDGAIERNINLNSIGFVNETPVTIWVKIYDVRATGGTGNNVNLLPANRNPALSDTNTIYQSLNTHNLRLNIAVPPNGSRDLNLAFPIKFIHGIYAIASSNYSYSSSAYPVGGSNVFIHGTWAKVVQN